MRQQNPPENARAWGTIYQKERYKGYRDRYYQEHRDENTPTRATRQEMEHFRQRLKRGIRTVRQRYLNAGFDMTCGCWYPLVTVDLTQTRELPSSTWKRVLRELGWHSKITHIYALKQHLRPDDPQNRVMKVSIAAANPTGQENHMH